MVAFTPHHPLSERWRDRILLAVVFLILYPAMIVYLTHKVEQRSNRHANRVSCIRYNDLVFAVNLFHGTVQDFIGKAKKSRERDLKALQAPGPPGMPPSLRVKKLIAADKQAIRDYGTVLRGIRTTPYEDSCPVPRKVGSHVQH